MKSVLFVCLGNICRSPTAEAVFRAKVAKENLMHCIEIDSAGTGDWHIGEPPDHRAQAAGLARGFDLSALRARQVKTEDFQKYDWIIAMDQNNLRDLKKSCPPAQHARLSLLLDYLPPSQSTSRDVPDPYYGPITGFDHVLDLVETACDGLLSQIKRAL